VSGSWFYRNVAEALADDALKAAIASTSSKKMASRAAAVREVENFDTLRDLAKQIKQHTLDHLDHYLDEFARNVEASGGVVHRAATAEQANACILGIARRNGLTSCVKVKSMTTEEIGLTAALEGGGVHTVETDLGEFIVQIDDDRPSHIVTPIIHKNRKQVATAMVRELGIEYTEDPETLTMHARRHLRGVFRTCDMGVSGVNFAAADTGTICICTNEGNGRLTVTRPKVHVALMGIEKVIPRLADLSIFLKILARSSTGQPITVYNSLVTGPRRRGDRDGPEQLHVVLLDNGRSRVRLSEYREALQCIRCGACLNACPVYRRIGGHAYDSTYPGPIGKLLAPLLGDSSRYADLPQASSLCGLCKEVCPVQIDIPGLLVKLRRDQVTGKNVPLMRRLGFRLASAMLTWPRGYHLGRQMARWLSAIGAEGEWIAKLPPPVSEWTKYHDWPRPAKRSFRSLWKEEQLSQRRNEK